MSHLLQRHVQLSDGRGRIRPLGDEDVTDARAALDGSVHRGLERDGSAPPHALVTGEHGLTLSCQQEVRRGSVLAATKLRSC